MVGRMQRTDGARVIACEVTMPSRIQMASPMPKPAFVVSPAAREADRRDDLPSCVNTACAASGLHVGYAMQPPKCATDGTCACRSTELSGLASAIGSIKSIAPSRYPTGSPMCS